MTGTDQGVPGARRRRWPLLLWLIPIVALVVAIAVSTTQARENEKQDGTAAAQAVVDLVSKALAGDPDALKKLVPRGEDSTLLTPAAAERALGKNYRVEAMNASLSSHSGENTATVKIVAEGGEILVTLPVTHSSKTDVWEARGPLNLPTVSTTDYRGDPETVYTINGEDIPLRQLSGGAPTWPGRLTITPPRSDVFAYATPPETFLGGRLSSQFDGATARVDASATLTPDFLTRAKATVEAWLKPCLVADDKMPAWCPVRPPTGPGLRQATRNVVWSAPAVIAPGDEQWLRENDATTRSRTPLVFDVFSMDGVLVGAGQFKDGDTWRDYREATFLSLRGTLSVDGNTITFTQDADAEAKYRKERS
ncbi:hypothetical protein [Galactobacter valiniphilus]|uniref:hypothetical protein n=1 Tax=Galactobacter valiniphilus TaxID=2676122 RepID=UPI003736F59C